LERVAIRPLAFGSGCGDKNVCQKIKRLILELRNFDFINIQNLSVAD
jgi:hypothetical protein